MPNYPIIILGLLTGLFPLSLLSVLLHELGHATAALILSRRAVRVYIGTHQATDDAIRILSGRRLSIAITRKPRHWRKGICQYEDDGLSINKQILITLMGPLVTLLLMIAAFSLVLQTTEDGYWRYVALGFLIGTVIELLANAIPNDKSIKDKDQPDLYNDAEQIRQLLLMKRAKSGVWKALQLYRQRHFTEAIALFEAEADTITGRQNLYALTHCYLEGKMPVQALQQYQRMVRDSQPNINELILLAAIHDALNNRQQAIDISRQALQLDPRHKLVLNNLGYYLICNRQYTDALPHLQLALQIDPTFTYALNNMGLALIKTGQPQTGLEYIDRSLSLDPENAWALRNKGVYYLDTQQPTLALPWLQQAKAINPDLPDVDALLAAANG